MLPMYDPNSHPLQIHQVLMISQYFPSPLKITSVLGRFSRLGLTVRLLSIPLAEYLAHLIMNFMFLFLFMFTDRGGFGLNRRFMFLPPSWAYSLARFTLFICCTISLCGSLVDQRQLRNHFTHNLLHTSVPQYSVPQPATGG